MKKADNSRRAVIQAAGAALLLPVVSALPRALQAATPPSLPTAQGNAAARLKVVQKGGPTTYAKSRGELDYIGMPVGGIGCGTLYLSGDGRLWLWDIFNLTETYLGDYVSPKTDDQFSEKPARDGGEYVAALSSSEVRLRDPKQGFLISIKTKNPDGSEKEVFRTLDAASWPEVEFLPSYPIGTIRYIDPALAFSITLQAFSPFIPLNEDDSGLPATILSFSVQNHGASPATVTLLGWLENRIAVISGPRYQSDLRMNASFSSTGQAGFIASLNANTSNTNVDVGQMILAARDGNAHVFTDVALPLTALPSTPSTPGTTASRPVQATAPLIGGVSMSKEVAAGTTAAFDFVVAWYFPRFNVGFFLGTETTSNLHDADNGRYYVNKFGTIRAVTDHIFASFDTLAGTTRLWVENWYNNSTLPYWFAERTLCNISTLATSATWRLKSGRMWEFEGIATAGAYPGTCTHVFQYSQAPARLFPALERYNRQHVDLGFAQVTDGGPASPGPRDGGILYRGETQFSGSTIAVDGQAGTILRIYREHQMAANSDFLRSNWPNVKRAILFLMRQDTDSNGLVDTQLENTLDAQWIGEMGWISGLAIAAIEAGRRMAEEMGDPQFQARCKLFVDTGKKFMVEKLYLAKTNDIGWFIQVPPKGRDTSTTLGAYNTCHIDQVLGQSWAHQVGLGPLWDQGKTANALRALMKYNFTTDVAPYLKMTPAPRPYALAGEAGMVMNTNPNNDPNPYHSDSSLVRYFRECMTGFEHQVASHLMAEGMVDDSLKVTRAIYDRYHAKKRNPFNEVEAGNHYGRAMASYGSFITACGFEHHGPKGYIRFAPKFNQTAFQAPFTSASGWGTYKQAVKSGQEHTITMAYGSLTVSSIGLQLASDARPRQATVSAPGGATTLAMPTVDPDGNFLLTLPKPIVVKTRETLTIAIS